MRQPVLGIPLGVQACSLNRPLQVIEHRQNVAKNFSFPLPRGGKHIRAHPLPVVLEIRFRPLGEVEVLVPLIRVADRGPARPAHLRGCGVGDVGTFRGRVGPDVPSPDRTRGWGSRASSSRPASFLVALVDDLRIDDFLLVIGPPPSAGPVLGGRLRLLLRRGVDLL